MSHSTRLSRLATEDKETAMRIALALLLGLVLAANGLYMLSDPAGWYALVPGVPDTGPLNPHFVRDIGCAYVMSGGTLVWFAFDHRARPAALAGGVFLALHAIVHVADAIAGRDHPDHMTTDLVAVFAPPALALWLALPSRSIERRTTMLNWLIKRQIDAFEQAYGYDSSYARDILAADRRAFMKFAKLLGLSRYRKDVPRDAWYAAKITATLAEDCGPCTQLNVTMAERDGVAPDVLRAIVTGDERAMLDHVALVVRFTKAVLAHAIEADDLRERIRQRWGSRALVSLSFAIAAGRIFPTVKYALGHGRACRRVTVGGAPIPVLKQAA
jgi:hypothetical protein